MKQLLFSSTSYQHAYSDDIEEGTFDCDDYFTHISIAIIEQEIDDDDFEEINQVEIGIMQVLLYNVDKAFNNREHVLDIADSQNQELSNAILSIFSSKTNGLKDKYRGMDLTDNVLYLERLFIKPSYRGLGYGNFILKNINNLLYRLMSANFACMVMQPAAFEYSNHEEYDNLIKDNDIPNGKRLTERLYKFYKRHGFKSVRGSQSLYKVCE